MRCRLVRKVINEYAAGRLTAERRCQIAEHLQHCPECSGHLQSAKGVSRFVQMWTVPDPPAAWDARVIAQITSGKAKQTSRFIPWPLWIRPALPFGRLSLTAAMSAAAFVAVILLPLQFYLTGTAPVIRASLPVTTRLPVDWADTSNAPSVPNGLLTQEIPATLGHTVDVDLDWADRMILRSSFRKTGTSGLPVLPASETVRKTDKVFHVIDFSSETVHLVSQFDVTSY